jgi:hypothetical protein
VNIIEAIKLGMEVQRPIRRPLVKFMGSEGSVWFPAVQIKDELLAGPWISGAHKSVTRRPDHAITEEDLFADDWEVQPPRFKRFVTIGASQK